MEKASTIIKLKKGAKEIAIFFNTLAKTLKLGYEIAPIATVLYSFTYVVIYLTPIGINYLQSLLIDRLVLSAVEKTLTRDATLIVSIFLTAFFLRTIVALYSDFIESKIIFDFDKKIDLSIINKYSQLDLEYFEDPKTSDLLQKVSSNEYKARMLYITTQYLIGDFAALIASIGIVLTFSPFILFLIIISNIPTLIAEGKLGKSIWGIWDYKPEDFRNQSWTRDILIRQNSLKEVRVFRARNFLYSIVEKLFNEFIEYQVNVEKKRFKYEIILRGIPFLVFAYSFYFLVNQVVAGIITIGLFTFYFSTLNTFSSTLNSMFKRFTTLYENALFVSDYFKIMNLPKLVKDGEVVLEPNTSPTIEFKNVDFKYPHSSQYVFKGFNLEIKPGEHIAIVGENGAGKSTLINLLLRFYDATDGSILINGTDLKDFKLDSYYKNIALLGQDFAKYHYDAKTNIGLGNIEHINNLLAIIEASKFSGSDKFIEKYEKGYDQILNKQFTGGIEPSEGQWQKIALSRAFYKDAPILILDEPTSAIDPKAESEIFERLFTYAKDKTVIIISHRFSTVRNADRILVMNEGRIVEEGSHSELVALNGIYKEAYDLQKKGYLD